uniref:Uncharacterized protein n=1 Tax=Oryza meridionalis TaxID=40149 RepID=A0A0E0C500_9ORYZ
MVELELPATIDKAIVGLRLDPDSTVELQAGSRSSSTPKRRGTMAVAANLPQRRCLRRGFVSSSPTGRGGVLALTLPPSLVCRRAHRRLPLGGSTTASASLIRCRVPSLLGCCRREEERRGTMELSCPPSTAHVLPSSSRRLPLGGSATASVSLAATRSEEVHRGAVGSLRWRLGSRRLELISHR